MRSFLAAACWISALSVSPSPVWLYLIFMKLVYIFTLPLFIIFLPSCLFPQQSSFSFITSPYHVRCHSEYISLKRKNWSLHFFYDSKFSLLPFFKNARAKVKVIFRERTGIVELAIFLCLSVSFSFVLLPFVTPNPPGILFSFRHVKKILVFLLQICGFVFL